jgi:acetyl-CoA C-acetyltransferase
LPVTEVIIGNTVGPGGNLARLALLQAGLPVSVPGLTVDRQCGSGLDAVWLGALHVMANPQAAVLAGGVESVSTSPLLRRLANGTPYVARAQMAPEWLGDPDMIEAAEFVAARYGISRQAQDQWSCLSMERTLASVESGRLNLGIVAVDGCKRDEWRAKRLRPERLARYPSLMKSQKHAGGTVTAANSAPPADGAAMLLLGTHATLASCRQSHSRSPQALARIVAYAAAGVTPQEPGIGPVPALQQACAQAGISPRDLDRIEINEAFAAQVLACMAQLDLDPSQVNPEGGAIALGHPFGATGALLLVRLIYGLQPGQLGAVSLGIGGGLGVAMIIQRGEEHDAGAHY